MTLYAAYVPLMNFLARLFGAIAFVVGAFSLVGAYAFKADPWTRVVAGVLAGPTPPVPGFSRLL